MWTNNRTEREPQTMQMTFYVFAVLVHICCASFLLFCGSLLDMSYFYDKTKSP